MTQTYWTYENNNGEPDDYEFETQNEAEEYATERLFERCEDNGDRYGEEELTLIEFKFNEDTGEKIVIQRVPFVAEYEYYRGDLAEHGYP